VAEDHKTGRFLGLPYDWRKPTRARLKRGVWNPDERRVFVPKVYGWGYGVNFHELARLLGLIERPRFGE
jgi:hypothetical protein